MTKHVSLSVRLWITSLIFLTALGFVIQFIVIPFGTPSLNAGDGLVANTDSVTFHRAAIELMETINQGGWEHWQLRPALWGHVGISSAIYKLTTPKPWVLVPVAASLLALAIVLLFHILRLMGISAQLAALASMILLVLPSTAMLTAQWHKDQIAIPSTFAIVVGFLLLWRNQVVKGTSAIAAGIFGLWLVRDHIIEVMAGAALVGAIAAAVAVRWNDATNVRALIRLVIAAVCMAAASQYLPSWTDNLAVSQVTWQQWTNAAVEGRASGTEQADDPTAEVPVHANAAWNPSTWIPALVERRLASFVQVREASIRGTGHGCSSVDTDVTFTSAASVVEYAPRAAAIALLAPFPTRWFGTACSGGGRFLSLVSAGEMIIAYLAFLAVPQLVWQFRRQPTFWFVVALCLCVLIIHGFIFVNIGTIFRTRYAWFEMMVALGAAGWITMWVEARHSLRQSAKSSSVEPVYDS
jgi:hypothetical protein